MSEPKRYSDIPEPRSWDTGKNAYREPGEPHDGRNLVINRRSFWSSPGEELAWLYAAEQAKPFRRTDTFLQHLERIATIAGAELAGKPAKDFPAARLPYPEDSE